MFLARKGLSQSRQPRSHMTFEMALNRKTWVCILNAILFSFRYVCCVFYIMPSQSTWSMLAYPRASAARVFHTMRGHDLPFFKLYLFVSSIGSIKQEERERERQWQCRRQNDREAA